MKPGVFTQLYIQLIFAPKYRDKLLVKEIRPEVFRYISGIISNKGHKSIIINGVIDHVHIFLGLNPSESISDLVAAIKSSSSKFINDNKLLKGRFHWQDGYGAFSYSQSQIENVFEYIKKQEEHHRLKTFKEEYLNFLEKFNVPFDRKFLFDFFD